MIEISVERLGGAHFGAAQSGSLTAGTAATTTASHRLATHRSRGGKLARMKLNSNGRWEIYGGIDRSQTFELTARDLVYVEVEVAGHDQLQPTRIEFDRAACARKSLADSNAART